MLFSHEKPYLCGDNSTQPKNPTTNDMVQILIIDDEDPIRNLLARIIELEGYKVWKAADCQSALKQMNAQHFNVVLCDVFLPDGNGVDFIFDIKKAAPDAAIILLTALNMDEKYLEGIEAGADAYITKPFSPKLLLARAFQLIKQREKLRKKFSDDPGMITPAICTSEKDKQFADKLQAILEEQISNSEFAVDDLASVMGLGRSTFYRKVRGITGYSPNEYMRIIRMKKAAELLLENRYTVAEVSYKIGIEDPFYFSKCFKQKMGMTPTEYRDKGMNKINSSKNT